MSVKVTEYRKGKQGVTEQRTNYLEDPKTMGVIQGMRDKQTTRELVTVRAFYIRDYNHHMNTLIDQLTVLATKDPIAPPFLEEMKRLKAREDDDMAAFTALLHKMQDIADASPNENK